MEIIMLVMVKILVNTAIMIIIIFDDIISHQNCQYKSEELTQHVSASQALGAE